MEQSFPGFNSESFAFFRELAQNNSKPWFDQNRERYEQDVQGAFRGLLASLEPSLTAWRELARRLQASERRRDAGWAWQRLAQAAARTKRWPEAAQAFDEARKGSSVID